MPDDNSRNVVHIGSQKLGRKVKRADISRQTPDEEAFKATSANSLSIIPTPYSLQALTVIVQESSITRQCIDAMIANTASNGFMIVPFDDDKTLDDVDSVELDTLNSYIQYANPNESLSAISELLVSDYETYGYSFREVIRSRNGRVSGLRHAPAYNIRILSDSAGYVEVTRKVKRGGRRTTVRELRLFKKYVQQLASVGTTGSIDAHRNKGLEQVYFKEFGDPRRMDYRNGRYQEDNYTVEDTHLATEILHERQISPDAYGIPIYTSALPAILGTRESETVNLDYFENNTVPPAMLTVSGGRLTQKSFQALDELLSGKGLGKDRAHQMLLIEAIAESNGLDEGTGTVQINLEKLTDVRQSDGLFKDYEQSAAEKVRSLYRIPPILLGLSSGNYSNSTLAIHTAETQVFEPSRSRHDNFWNMNLVNHPEGLNLQTVKLKSKSMSLTESSEVVKAMATVNVAGGLTPRTAVHLSRNVLSLDIPKYPEKGEDGYEDWMDVPTPLSTRSANENKPEAEGRESESSPEYKLKNQEEIGTTKEPENSEK